jgi:hypothetical protein
MEVNNEGIHRGIREHGQERLEKALQAIDDADGGGMRVVSQILTLVKRSPLTGQVRRQGY